MQVAVLGAKDTFGDVALVTPPGVHAAVVRALDGGSRLVRLDRDVAIRLLGPIKPEVLIEDAVEA